MSPLLSRTVCLFVCQSVEKVSKSIYPELGNKQYGFFFADNRYSGMVYLYLKKVT